MKTRYKLFVLILMVSSVAVAETPSIVTDGFEKYKDKGASEALATWLHGSALEGDTTTRLNMIGGITQIEAAYGPIESYEILAIYCPSSKLRRVYAVSYHAKGPVFWNFDLYRATTGWVDFMFNCNTKPQVILPEELIDKKANHVPDPTPASVTPAAGQPARQP
jgi:hypothetical protein